MGTKHKLTLTEAHFPLCSIPIAFWISNAAVRFSGIRGAVSIQTQFPGTTLEWDAAKMTFTNHTEANRFIRRQYRRGWEVEGL